MERSDPAVATKILSYGAIIEIKKGSLQPGAGFQYVGSGHVHPCYLYELPNGEEGFIKESDLSGWLPRNPVESAPLPHPMSEFSGAPALNDKTPAFLNRP
jgi:hypothetical protein